jgi:glycosyltransferase involved in cell wall biosynthesis
VLTVDTLRVAIVADLLEEGWPSMDLVADMLMSHVAGGASLTPTLMRPRFAPANGNGHEAPPTYRRIGYRFWSYPRWLRQQPAADVYHIVDHSYAHLVHDLPPGRVVVTCHDTDAFRSLLPSTERESVLPRWLVKRTLRGLQRAAVIACISEVTRESLVSQGLVPREKTTVSPLGVHPACTPAPERDAESAAAKLTGRTTTSDLLHVGSTIPRKRIDVLLETLALVARTRPDVRLWRVGGAFTPEQAKRARELGIENRIVVLPFVTRNVLAALYRRAALVLLPSEREGFGLPVIEAMACGTPVLCTDLPVLREVGGDAAEYCPLGESSAWARRVTSLLRERDRRPDLWDARRAAGLDRSAAFTWTRYAAAMQDIYERVAAEPIA